MKYKFYTAQFDVGHNSDIDEWLNSFKGVNDVEVVGASSEGNKIIMIVKVTKNHD